MKIFIQEVLLLLGGFRKKLPGILFLFIVVAIIEILGIGLLAPYISLIADPSNVNGQLKTFNDIFQISIKPDEALTLLSYGIVSIFLIRLLLGLQVTHVITKFSMQQQTLLREKIIRAYQSISYEQYLGLNSSELIYNIQTLVPKFSEGVIFFGLKAISSIVLATITALFLFFVNTTAFIVLAGVFVIFGIAYDQFFKVRIKEYGTLANYYSSNIIKGAKESSDGLKEIKILGCEKYFFDVIRNNSIQFGHVNTRLTVLNQLPRYVLELILVLLMVFFVFWQGDTVRSSENLTVLTIFAVAGLRLIPVINEVISATVNFRSGRDAVSRLYASISSHNLSQELSFLKSCPFKDKEYFSSVELKIDNFHYPDSNVASISNVHIKIESGKSIGIIGPSGSGKTTLVDLLLGLLSPAEGSVLVNGKSLNDPLIKKCWHDSVAYLPQELFLVDNTLAFNISFGIDEDDIDFNRLDIAIKNAHLTDLIEQLPLGVKTLLGDRGIRLSGGQKQRVALARAFYHDREVLIMDESTSSLDRETEHEIIQEVKMLKGKKTIIIIAHNLSTVKNCDFIYKLNNGSVISSGVPHKMLGNN